MASFEKFEDIKAWQVARAFCQEIHQLSINTGLKNDFSLNDQINRSGGSMMDNIAEGFGRGSNTEFIRFLEISHGSSCESQSQLYRILDKKYISEEKFQQLYQMVVDVQKMVKGLMKYLSTSLSRGIKASYRQQ